MKKYKFSLKSFNAPTPGFWKKLGYGLLGASSIFSIGGIWQFSNLTAIFTPEQLRWIISGSIAFGFLGKFLTSFIECKDEDSKSNKE